MLMKHVAVLDFMISLRGDAAGSKHLGIFYMDNVGLYTATKDEIQTLIRIESNFFRHLAKPTSYHVRTLYT